MQMTLQIRLGLVVVVAALLFSCVLEVESEPNEDAGWSGDDVSDEELAQDHTVRLLLGARRQATPRPADAKQKRGVAKSAEASAAVLKAKEEADKVKATPAKATPAKATPAAEATPAAKGSKTKSEGNKPAGSAPNTSTSPALVTLSSAGASTVLACPTSFSIRSTSK